MSLALIFVVVLLSKGGELIISFFHKYHIYVYYMDISTNIIQNVYNIGTNSCSAGTQYCSDGYALYFPCLKDITKGQDVCFDFYIADSTTKDVMDLRDVDDITLNLIGPFNCVYGSFSYSDDSDSDIYENAISSLQTEKYPVVYEEEFGSKDTYQLKVFMVDTEQPDKVINIKKGDYFEGTEVEIAAYDTPNYIFTGWYCVGADDEECSEASMYESNVCWARVHKFTIKKNLTVFALYRHRKIYKVQSDETNMSSHFDIYNNEHYLIPCHISNRNDEIFDEVESIVYQEDSDDETYQPFDEIEVMEGYSMLVNCIPSKDEFRNSDSDGECMTYEFIQWKDGNEYKQRLFVIGKDTKAFEDGDIIKLKAHCIGPVPCYESEEEIIHFNRDIFDEDGIHINSLINSENGLSVKYDEAGKGYYLHFNNGSLTLSSQGIEDGVKVNIYARADGDCTLTVNINGGENSEVISTDEYMLYEFICDKCNGSDIVITSEGKCFIDKIEICKEEIVDKGKAQLCLPPEITANLPSGQLSVNGAVIVNGTSYGLATTQIGNVNRLPKITLTN